MSTGIATAGLSPAAESAKRNDTPVETQALTVTFPAVPALPGRDRRDFLGDLAACGGLLAVLGLGAAVAPSRTPPPVTSLKSGQVGQLQRAINEAETWVAPPNSGGTLLTGTCSDGRVVHLKQSINSGPPEVVEYTFRLLKGKTLVFNYTAKSRGGSNEEYEFAAATFDCVLKRPAMPSTRK